MIGVIAHPSDHGVVCEFFELFKTPWEFYGSDRQYDVVLCCGEDSVHKNSAKLVLIYAGRTLPSDIENKIEISSQGKRNCLLSYKGMRIPIYGDCAAFGQNQDDSLVDENSRESALHVGGSIGKMLVRVGYDILGEIRALLTVGQPVTNASIPTLELHIALLRDLILASGAALIEIPPVPDGHKLIASLTHDIDHPAIRQHRFDHTMFGFLYRAIFGSLFNLVRGRASVRSVLTNWTAVLKLPLIHLGLASDFWNEFGHYIKLEQGFHSTFFVIPYKGDAGLSRFGRAPRHRASPYNATDIADQIRSLLSAGCEIGVHGINAWLDSSKGRKELEEIRSVTGLRDLGTRMHWLYFDEQSPAVLESAGVSYDSTIGYNETVGYRAGTTQVYKPLNASRLLELPLHVMDTALFYPAYLDLSSLEASKRVAIIIDKTIQFGGGITVNWHDRSISPERLWGSVYVSLVDELRTKGAWFASASQTVSWFRMRRSAIFEIVDRESGALCIRVKDEKVDDLPGLRLRIHKVRKPHKLNLTGLVDSKDVCDIGFKHAIGTAMLSHTRGE